MSDIGAAALDQYGVRTSDGAFVVVVTPGSPASKGGLAIGDVITAIDGQPVTGPDDVGSIVREHEAGDQITVTIERAGTIQSLQLQVGSRATTPTSADGGD